MRTIILILFLAPPAFPQMLRGIVGGKPPAAAGFTAQVTVSGAKYDVTKLNRLGSLACIASRVPNSASYTITKFEAPLYKANSPTFNMRAYVYTDGSGVPGTKIGTESGEVSASTIPSSEGDSVVFTGMNAAVTADYWIVVCKTSGTDNYYVDYVNWGFINNGSGTTQKNLGCLSDVTSCTDATGFPTYKMPGKGVIYSTP